VVAGYIEVETLLQLLAFAKVFSNNINNNKGNNKRLIQCALLIRKNADR